LLALLSALFFPKGYLSVILISPKSWNSTSMKDEEKEGDKNEIRHLKI
jgi:hypothetical protein